MQEQDLAGLAERLGKEIESLPKDGKEHTIKIKIEGANTGNISLGGTQITIHSQQQQQNEKTLSDLSIAELQNLLKHYKAEHRSGWWGFWLNLPMVLLASVMLLLLGMLISGKIFIYMKSNLSLVNYSIYGVVVVVAMLGYWLNKIRRVEARHMADSQANIDEVQAVLRRRRGR